jgi:hypothetical protein
MFTFKADVTTPMISQAAIDAEASKLATEMAEEYARSLKLAVVTAHAIARGELLASPKVWQTNLGSRSLFKRFVTASRHWIFVDRGRRKGSKMPIHQIGISKRGKPVFAPVPELVRWFLLLNIPSRAWWPIMRKIARRGIPAKNIQSIALRNAQVRWVSIIQFRAREIVLRMFVRSEAENANRADLARAA